MAEQAQVALRLCSKHPSEEIDLYCKVCKKTTCNECLQTDHVGHSFDTIAKLYRKIKNTRPDLIREFEQKINPKRSQNRRNLRNVKCRNENVVRMNLGNVERKRKEMYDAVDKIIDAHVETVTSRGALIDREIKRHEDSMETEESTLLRMIETFRQTTMVGLDLIEYYENLKSKIYDFRTIDLSHYVYTNKQVYREGDVVVDDLKKMIGEIMERNTKDLRTEQISSFQHKQSQAHTICPISRDKAWITYNGSKEFTSLLRDGHHVNSVLKDTETHSFTFLDNAFLLCNDDEKTILKVDMSGKKSPWMSVSPLLPRFIGNAMNKNILITLADEYIGFRTNNSNRIVQMVSPSGKVLHQYEYSEDGTTPVLTFPTRVTQNYNSDVCVSNRFRNEKNRIGFSGNVCVFYEDGRMKSIYNGHDKNFCPSGLSCDILCNIICVDEIGKTIHIIAHDGSFQQYLLTSKTCLPDPISLALHRGVLWVGSNGGEVRVYRYIH